MAAAPEPGTTRGTADLVKDVTSVIALLVTLTFVLGAGVLILRLAFEDLPWQAVLSQLPREFLIGVGVSQVLVFGLAVAAIHGLFRVVARPGFGPPRRTALVLLAAVAYVVAVAVVRIFETRAPEGTRDIDPDTWFWWVVYLGLAVAIAVVALLRSRGDELTTRLPAPAVMTFAYSVVAMLTATLAAGTVPLLEAQACFKEGFRESGALIGQSGDRIFLGEQNRSPRRIVSLDAGEVEELFIGDQASDTRCDSRGPGAAVVAVREARKAERALPGVEKKAAALRRAAPAAAGDAAAALSEAIVPAARAARTAADAADGVVAGVDDTGVAARDAYYAGLAARDHAARLQAMARRRESAAALRRGADQALRPLRDAITQARRAADLAFEAAQEPDG